ncbi:MAG TPA: hypothetical protein PLK31_22540, partial [Chloroflexota bacterium]|nr:hypothetical protein [Chloroflexota bacterium]
MKHRPSLPLQLFIITVLPLTALLLLIAFGSLGLHQRAMRHMVGERDERATRAAASAITEQINHRRSAIRSVALHAANVDAGPAHALTDAAFLLPYFEGGMALFAANGERLAASTDAALWQMVALPEQPTASAGRESYFLPPVTDPESGEVYTLVAATEGEVTAVGAFSATSLARRALADIFG